MPWLVRDGRVLATLEVADTARARMRGLLGRDGIDGALLLRPARGVHTLRLRFPIDVAYCDADLRVLKVVTMRRNRVGLPVWRARAVLETEAGVARSWELRPGDRLEVRPTFDLDQDDAAPRGPVGPAADPSEGPVPPARPDRPARPGAPGLSAWRVLEPGAAAS